LQRILQCEGVDHRSEHAHVVALAAIHPLACAFETAEDVSSPNDQADFYAGLAHLCDLCGGRIEGFGVNARASTSSERLSAQLEQYPTVAEFLALSRVKVFGR